MYLDKKRLENGRYRYLLQCADCPDQRWTGDIRSSRCRSCAKHARRFDFCRVWPARCKMCDRAMMIKSKPKIDGVAMCQQCKGYVNGKRNLKVKTVKEKIKCSECPTIFEPKNSMIKTCSKLCSTTRKNRLKREKAKPLLSKKVKKERRDKAKFNSDKPINPPEKARMLGGVDKDDKPKYIRAHQKKAFEFREHNTGPNQDELSEKLLKEFFDKGGKPSVEFKPLEDVGQPGSTDSIRGGSYGY